jgi:hypothetical protein
MKPYRGPPMTLGSAAAAKLRLAVWCKACGRRSEPDPAEQARWYGPETPVPEWRRRLVCSQCGSRNVDMVVTGTRPCLKTPLRAAEQGAVWVATVAATSQKSEIWKIYCAI